ncbi:hypothetical protein KC359_g130 [Hortaea werneckii]|nr:hypothetical protein KC359_g130 [Hortaea werneckii]
MASVGFSGSFKKNSSGVMKGMPTFTAKSLSEQEWSFLTPFFLSPSLPAASPTNSDNNAVSIAVQLLKLGGHGMMPPFPIIRSFSKAIPRFCRNQRVVEIESRNFDGLVALKLVGIIMARHKHRVLYDMELHGVRLPLLLRYGLEKVVHRTACGASCDFVAFGRGRQFNLHLPDSKHFHTLRSLRATCEQLMRFTLDTDHRVAMQGTK